MLCMNTNLKCNIVIPTHMNTRLIYMDKFCIDTTLINFDQVTHSSVEREIFHVIFIGFVCKKKKKKFHYNVTSACTWHNREDVIKSRICWLMLIWQALAWHLLPNDKLTSQLSHCPLLITLIVYTLRLSHYLMIKLIWIQNLYSSRGVPC
jgi:hypothetical protein